MHNFKPSLKFLEAWSQVYMVIWYEISMTEQKRFIRAFRNLRKLLGTHPEDEPRVHIVTAGDFPQLPPCFAGYIFDKPAFTEIK